MNTNQSLQNKIDNAKELDFGNILNRTFDLYKKTWSQGFILILLGVLVITPFIVLVFMPTYLSMVEQAASGDYDYSTPNYFRQSQPESFRYMELGLTFFISFITTGLLAGFYRIIKRIDFGESYKFLDFLYFFKMKNLGKMFAIASFSFLNFNNLLFN